VTYVPPPPRQRNKLLHHITKYPPVLTAESAFVHADFLREAMSDTQVDATERWQHLWQGDAAISFERTYLLVKDISDFYRALHAETIALLKAVSLPNIRKKNAARAPEWILSRLLTDRFQKAFGQPFDGIVAALTSVVFDQEAGVGDATIRGRRRGSGRAAHSPKNSH
jgi:hypothetical protein